MLSFGNGAVFGKQPSITHAETYGVSITGGIDVVVDAIAYLQTLTGIINSLRSYRAAGVWITTLLQFVFRGRKMRNTHF
jgi:hypothetical protein